MLGDRGQLRQAHACFEEALAGIDARGHKVEGSVLCWRSAVCLWQGRWDDARTATEAQHIAERVKSLYQYAMSRSLGAYANWKTSRSRRRAADYRRMRPRGSRRATRPLHVAELRLVGGGHGRRGRSRRRATMRPTPSRAVEVTSAWVKRWPAGPWRSRRPQGTGPQAARACTSRSL